MFFASVKTPKHDSFIEIKGKMEFVALRLNSCGKLADVA